ncbi:MAG: hypothetical protein K2M92_04870, partial [Bacteroidales bacterium]|nr:hypothetical protein [Bacteroidales bacterium]
AGSYRVAYITPNRDTLYHEPSTLWVGSYADPSMYLTLSYPIDRATDMCPGETANILFRDKNAQYEVFWPGDSVYRTVRSNYAKAFNRTDTVHVLLRSVLGGCEVATDIEVIVRQATNIDLSAHDTTICYEPDMYAYFPQILDTGGEFYIKYEWTTLDEEVVGSGNFLVQNTRFLVEPDTNYYLARAATGYAECPSNPDTFRVVAHRPTWTFTPSEVEVCAGTLFPFHAGTPFDSIRFGEGLWQPRGNDSFTLGPIYKDSVVSVTILRKVCESVGKLNVKIIERDTLAVTLAENADACVALAPVSGTNIDLGLHAQLQYRVQGTENSAFAGLVYKNHGTSAQTMPYSFYMMADGAGSTHLYIYLSGVQANMTSFGTVAEGDMLAISREQGNVLFYRNGELLYSTAETSRVEDYMTAQADVDGNTALTNITLLNLPGSSIAATVASRYNDRTYAWYINGNQVDNVATLDAKKHPVINGDTVVLRVRSVSPCDTLVKSDTLVVALQNTYKPLMVSVDTPDALCPGAAHHTFTATVTAPAGVAAADLRYNWYRNGNKVVNGSSYNTYD